MKTVKILGHDYKIIIDRRLNHTSNNSAMCFSDDLEIVIDSNIPQSRKEEDLLHEIVEAINFHLELNLEHRNIQGLSECLYSVLKDNGLIDLSNMLVEG